jgi:hypothetical protein
MSEVRTDQLKRAVEFQYGGAATLAQSVPVREEHNGQTVWQGIVPVFTGHPLAERAYAWSYELPDGKRRFFCCAAYGPLKSPGDAVTVAIVAEHRAK